MVDNQFSSWKSHLMWPWRMDIAESLQLAHFSLGSVDWIQFYQTFFSLFRYVFLIFSNSKALRIDKVAWNCWSYRLDVCVRRKRPVLAFSVPDCVKIWCLPLDWAVSTFTNVIQAKVENCLTWIVWELMSEVILRKSSGSTILHFCFPDLVFNMTIVAIIIIIIIVILIVKLSSNLVFVAIC